MKSLGNVPLPPIVRKNSAVGRIFGFLTIVKPDPNSSGRTRVICQCVCGNIKSIDRTSLRKGKIKSCGCMTYVLRRTKRKHKGSYRGVQPFRDTGKYIVQIRLNNTPYYLGLFTTEIEAAHAVDKKAIEVLGYPLNFTDEAEHDGEATEVLTVDVGKWETGR